MRYDIFNGVVVQWKSTLMMCKLTEEKAIGKIAAVQILVLVPFFWPLLSKIIRVIVHALPRPQLIELS